MAKKPRMTADEKDYAIDEALAKVADTKPLRKRMGGDRELRGRARQRIWRRYQAAGGDETDWKAFFDWLLKNLPAIIAIIASLFA